MLKMKHLVYIGNRLAQKHKTETTIDTLGKQLEGLGFKVSYASSYKHIGLRFIDMLFTVYKHRSTVDYVLIDTYSTLNFYYAYYVAKLCRVFNLKYIPILHGGNLPKRLKQSSKRSRKLFGKAYFNIAPSQYLYSSFKEEGYTNLVYIPNAIVIENYKFEKRPINSTVKLLWVRSFSKIYNPKLAVTIIKALKDKGIKAALCMVGPDNDGSLLETKDFAKQLGVDVEFTGLLSKANWHKKAQDYNIFINTTSIDNTPVSVIEAMALGLPVISTNVGGMPFLIENGKDGFLVTPNNSKAFVDVILKLVKGEIDTENIVENARLKVDTFSWDVIKQKWLSVLK